MLAEAAGYVIAISVWGFSLLTFAAAHPHVLTVIKVACSSYLLLLAVNMWTQGRMEEDKRAKAVTWRNLFVATLLNPKAFLLASTAFPLQAFHDAGNGVVAFGAFLLVLVPIGTGWASLGRVTSVRHPGRGILRRCFVLRRCCWCCFPEPCCIHSSNERPVTVPLAIEGRPLRVQMSRIRSRNPRALASRLSTDALPDVGIDGALRRR